MKIKTKSGFVIDVDEKRAKDWRFTMHLAEWEKHETLIQGLTACVEFLLGKDGEKALMDHVKDEDDFISSELMISEFREILGLLGEEVKKSASSQG